ncbi:exosortase family protein XrtF [Flavobacterium psychrotrophum]|uniref:exosortase family protein XrtF n=1 Tax=Flavobacterium psychrotrophum TaxID=2294119 RepID=UPI000E313B68|nr:exosortase family protein XrtF [Flavobacterium psychrotrophum]
MGILSANKAFFMFLGKFVASYLILTGLYMWYLSPYDTDVSVTDPVTHMVAGQARDVVHIFGQESHIEQHPREASDKFYVNGQSVSRIVEGCNAVSVMILFTAFIVAFSTSFKKTSLYIIAGVAIIYVLNILRIALITTAAYFYPQYSVFIHDVFFPLFIYGVVFLLWVVWVTKFYKNEKQAKA